MYAKKQKSNGGVFSYLGIGNNSTPKHMSTDLEKTGISRQRTYQLNQ